MAFNCINKFGIQTLYNFEKKICFSTENSDKSTELYVYMNDYKYRTKICCFRLTKNRYDHAVQCQLIEICKQDQFRLSIKVQEIFFRTHLHFRELH